MITVDQWLQTHYGAEVFRAGLTALEKFLSPSIREVLQHQPKIITIAGTNGKGETSFRLAQLLKEQNKSFKLWTSPHLLSVKERFVSGQGQISEEDLKSLFLTIESKKESKLSYYEFLFSVFLEWVKLEPCEYIILEVGLGGRLDAVSLLPAQLVLIPSISRDHQDYLGPTYRSILSEKLGVMGKLCQIQCLSSFETKYLRELTLQKISNNISYQDLFELGLVTQKDHFDLRNTTLAVAGLMLMAGEPLHPIKLREKAHELLKTKLAGRGERIKLGEKEFTFFGSHNPDGVRKLIQLLQGSHYTFREVLVSFSARDHKDLITQLKLIGLLGKEKVILTSFSHPKAASVDLLQDLASKEGIRFVKEWPPILQSAESSCLVTGSYYFVGAVQSYLNSIR